MRRRAGWWAAALLFLLVAAGGAACTVFVAWRSGREARRITRVAVPPDVLAKRRARGTGLFRAPDYVWLSPDTVLWLASRAGDQTITVNVRTGRETPFPLRFDPFLGTPPQVSPNGRRLLWSEAAKIGGPNTVTADVSGTGRMVWPQKNAAVTGSATERRRLIRTGWSSSLPLWLADGSGWTRLTRGNAGSQTLAKLFPAGPEKAPHHRAPRIVPVPGLSSPNHALGFTTRADGRQAVVVCSGSLHVMHRGGLGSASGAGFITNASFGTTRRTRSGGAPAPSLWTRLHAPAPPPTEVTLTHHPLGGGGKPGRFRVALPAGTRSGTLTLSPRGDKIAWLLAGEPRVSFVQQWLRRLVPAPAPPSSITTPTGGMRVVTTAPPPTALSLWVSRSDGSGLHWITDLPPEKTVAAPAAGTSAAVMVRYSRYSLMSRLFGPFFNVVRWTPDQKRVSFVRDDELWSVPAR